MLIENSVRSHVTSHIYSVYLYNSSHELSPYIQRVVLHHVEGHCTHDQYMLLVMQVHTAAGEKGEQAGETNLELNRKV